MKRFLLIIFIITGIYFIFSVFFESTHFNIWDSVNKISALITILGFILGFFAGDGYNQFKQNINNSSKKSTFLFNSNDNNIQQ